MRVGLMTLKEEKYRWQGSNVVRIFLWNQELVYSGLKWVEILLT